ncbi:MAG: CHAP domain protein [Candidatus Woesebacteria bacterium GW2011_GWB1_45_5]|uniref:CHAP domain protein n=1 Tax=Candidatus Woesebacteria bacterium GW2011_GWB1_45_5 TaxID=1618581 RepID=A0A0G1PUX4_9BACT|nr:MAG: CHAP domain protein [Candidatus Woesebacteria bacterium GW2011_GWB1_45_5]
MKIESGKKILLSLISLALLLSVSVVARAQCNNEAECNDLINKYTNEITKLQGQANTLKNQIAQFDAQVKLATLKISQTEEKIILLGGRIDQLEASLDSLTEAFSSRAVETYKLSKVENGFLYILSADDLGDAVSRFHYLQKIQEADRSLLTRLEEAQTTYEGEKTDQEELQKELEAQKRALSSQKAAKNALLSQTQNDEKKYQQLLSQAKAQLSAFRRFVIGQGGASILSNQTKCDGWGCYYNQRDSLWGNISLGGSPYSMAEYGCLVTSVSMIASHYGKSIKPNDIAATGSAFVPGTGYLYHSFNVNGISVSLSAVSKSVLDSELDEGDQE